jgi:hypothetical protein
MHYVQSGEREEEGNWNIWHTKMQKLIHNTSKNYPLKSTRVCVCVCAYVRARAHHHSTPAIVMVGIQCSYTFTPAFLFIACTGTALNSSPLGYRNLKCTTVPKYGTKIYFNMNIFDSDTSKYFNTL